MLASWEKGTMKRRRVVITGLGVVAPNGIGKDAFWANLVAGRSAVDYITAFDASALPCRVAAEVKFFDPTNWMNRKKAQQTSIVSQFAIAAAKLAKEDSGLEINDRNRKRVGVCFGTTLGKPDFGLEYENYLRSGASGISSLGWVETSPHASTSHIAIELGLRGAVLTISTGCATGLDAIHWAFKQIQSGTADAVIAGGADALLFPFLIAGLSRTGFLTRNNDPSTASRPYDRYRDGAVPAEAAGTVVLEALDAAANRSAYIYGEVLGYAGTIEGLNIPERDVAGTTLASALELALRRSGLKKEDIDCIHSHGISHPESDLMETNAFKEFFGKLAYSIPISSIKSMIGDSIAASGILQVVASALTLQTGIIPPTIHLKHPDLRCDLDYVPNRARKARVRNALMNARAIGGSHSVLVLSRSGFESL
jgi:3-oxoacyl-[acyl-carrier-protein] synthase II